MDEIWNEALNDKTTTLEDGRSWLQTAAAVKSGAWFEEEEEKKGEGEEAKEGGRERRAEGRDESPSREGDGGGADGHVMQQKIIPWDKLDLVRNGTAEGLASSWRCCSCRRRPRPRP